MMREFEYTSRSCLAPKAPDAPQDAKEARLTGKRKLNSKIFIVLPLALFPWSLSICAANRGLAYFHWPSDLCSAQQQIANETQ